MVTIDRLFAAISTCVILLVSLPLCHAQELNIPLPDSLSKESLQQIEQRYEKEIAMFGRLLLDLDRERYRQPDEGISIPVPASTDSATVQRVRDNYGEQIQKFSELLFEMDRERFRPGTDSLQMLKQKRRSLRSRISTWHTNLNKSKSLELELLMDYVYFRNDVAPRLSGRIIEVGPNCEIKTITAAFAQAKPGDQFKLESGEIEFGNGQTQNPITDIEICGNEEETTIKCSRELMHSNQRFQRVRFANVNFNCKEGRVAFGRDSQVEFKNCQFYNFGKTGYEALAGSGVTVLVEDCLFDGKNDRNGQPMLGRAFRFNQDDFVCLRKTKFIDNRELGLGNAVLDGCSAIFNETNNRRRGNDFAQGYIVKSRNSMLGARGYFANIEFETAFDDDKFVRTLMNSIVDNSELPKEMKDFVEPLNLQRNLQYWIGMIRTNDLEVRNFAAERVQKLTGLKVALPTPNPKSEDEIKQIAALIEQLNADKANKREEATEKLKAIGKPASDQLDKVLETGTLEQKVRAKMVLDSMVEHREIEIEKEAGRLMNWFEEYQNKLIYDAKSDSYKIEE